MDKQKRNKTIFIVVTAIAFLLLIGGGILTVISVILKKPNILQISLPLIGSAFIIYIILFIVLVFFFKKKEWSIWIHYGEF